MSSKQNMPFARGQTAGVTATTDLTQFEGMVFIVPDTKYGTGRDVRLRCVRNNTGIALSAKQLVVFTNANKMAVDGLTRLGPAAAAGPDHGVPVDDAYGSVTIAAGDLFYVIEAGPCMLVVSKTAGYESSIATGDILTAATAAASTHTTTAGRVAAGTLAITGNTAQGMLKSIFNHLGRAISARTTAETGADILVMIGLPFGS